VGTNAIRRIPSHDRGEFDAYLALPESGSGPGLVLLQEIFGVNDYLRGVADRLAGLGHVVLAPDLFWRLERNLDLGHDAEGMEEAVGLAMRYDVEDGALDASATLTFLRAMPEVSGKVGGIGFSLGGALAYSLACRAAPDCVVSFYGIGLEHTLVEAASPSCPIQLHLGTDDVWIPADALARVREVLEPLPTVELHLYEGAGHAFANPASPWHSPDATALAWGRAATFLAANLR